MKIIYCRSNLQLYGYEKNDFIILIKNKSIWFKYHKFTKLLYVLYIGKNISKLWLSEFPF